MSPPAWRRRPRAIRTKFNAAVQKILEDIIKEHGGIVFNGDGYTEAWHAEAEKRGLPNLRSCVDALPVLGSKEATELFEHYGVLSRARAAQPDGRVPRAVLP